MNIQIMGIRKSNETRKAERFFKERGIKFHFRDLFEKGISKGELENIKHSVPVEKLIDREGKQFKKRNLSYIVFDIEEELLNDPLLFKMPIVRNKNSATIGFEPEIWQNWLKEN